MLKWIKGFIIPALAIPVFFAGWFLGYHTAYKRGKNMGYVECYKRAYNEISEVRDKYWEARIELRVALMDLLDYKLKLQEKEGNK